MQVASRRIAAVIPIYQTRLDHESHISLKRNLGRLREQSTILLHPPSNSKLIGDIKSEFSKQPLQSISLRESDMKSISSYNRLMLSSRLYKLFTDYTHILIVQLDALLLHEKIEEWAAKGWSYIGAPFFVGLNKPKQPLRLLGGGNGGFSMRNVSDCLEVLKHWHWLYPAQRKHEIDSLPNERLRAEIRAAMRIHWCISGYVTNSTINEDLFWSFLAPELCKKFRVAPASVSMHFGWEAEPQHLYQLCEAQLPMGCHAWAKHDALFWMPLLQKIYQ